MLRKKRHLPDLRRVHPWPNCSIFSQKPPIGDRSGGWRQMDFTSLFAGTISI
jgi:hypothetical protein